MSDLAQNYEQEIRRLKHDLEQMDFEYEARRKNTVRLLAQREAELKEILKERSCAKIAKNSESQRTNDPDDPDFEVFTC